jgi:hypothetical protein
MRILNAYLYTFLWEMYASRIAGFGRRRFCRPRWLQTSSAIVIHTFRLLESLHIFSAFAPHVPSGRPLSRLLNVRICR